MPKLNQYYPSLESYDTGLAATAIAVDEPGMQQPEQVGVIDDINPEQAQEQIEQAEVALENLKTLAKLVKNAEQRGGMSPAIAQVTRFSHNLILGNIGIKPSHAGFVKPVQSFEDFKSASKRKFSTLSAYEKIQSNEEVLSGMIKTAKGTLARIKK